MSSLRQAAAPGTGPPAIARRLHPRLPLLALLALALALRLGHLTAVYDEPFFDRLAMDSQEYDRWAREVAAGAWLADEPFFQAPLYPYLLALLFRLAGHRLVLVYLLQIALALGGLAALYRTGELLRSPGTGLAAVALGALYGPFLFYDVQLLKESLAVTAVCFLLWALAAAFNREGPAGPTWLAAGLLLGLLTLLRENALLLVPLLALLPLLSRRHPWRRRWGAAGLLLAGFALPLVPPALHNARAGGGFLPTTFQGGVNFYLGNHPGADGTYQPLSPGRQTPTFERREPVRLAEEAVGRPLTGAEVSRYWLHKSLAWAAQSPGAFCRLQLVKLGLFFEPYERPDAVDYYWTRSLSPVLALPLVEWGGLLLLAVAGLLWVWRGPGTNRLAPSEPGEKRLAPWLPVLLFALAWTAATVAFFLFSRYRLPVVPALLLLAGVPLAELAGAVRQGRHRRALGLAALVASAWASPHLLGHQPRWDLVHYNLGRLHEDAGERDEAARHYRAALEANPRDFLACLNLGNLLARGGRLQQALPWFERAAEIEPRFDDAWANLGATHLALGDLPAAALALGRALELNPRSLTALHNRAVLALRQGDVEAARAFNQRLLALEPAHAPGLRLAGRLAAGEGDAP